MQTIDIGVNLTHQSLYQQLDDVIYNAKQAGVIHQIITGTSLETSTKALEISQNNLDYFSSTAGCHPHDAKDFNTDDLHLLKDLLDHSSVVAVGECGLDFNRNYSPKNIQEDVFKTQIELACETQLPLFMHQRDAHQRFIEMLSYHKNQFHSGVIHCFTGDKEQLKDCLDLGLYIGITGWLCDERRSLDLQDAVHYIPLDRILIETDSPYLLPRNIHPKSKSRTNVPANIIWVANKLAELLSLPLEQICKETTNNARTLFSLAL